MDRLGAAAGTTCAALIGDAPGNPPGSLQTTVDAGKPIVIDKVPVGPSVAVTLRAGHFVWGCADVTNLVPSADVHVDVQVFDEPLDLAKPTSIKLALTPDPATSAALMTSMGGDVGPTVFGVDEVTGLLDAMQGQAVGDFASARASFGWDTSTQHYFDASA